MNIEKLIKLIGTVQDEPNLIEFLKEFGFPKCNEYTILDPDLPYVNKDTPDNSLGLIFYLPKYLRLKGAETLDTSKLIFSGVRFLPNSDSKAILPFKLNWSDSFESLKSKFGEPVATNFYLKTDKLRQASWFITAHLNLQLSVTFEKEFGNAVRITIFIPNDNSPI
ncbi:hypothetical protein HR060_07060 [Catenovulum sp. SM1970]|uniref:hypothetical protein n=1 Tax=Marinifaba aquimaris TaxID=2741323 RepID=UPI001571C438|nr:hypothetical protein [Marinifaba aquimaris]NTS76626.1 hypothetical protein [Marinifaba aquimaris]